MKTTIPLFSIVLAFLSVTVSPQARATCQEGCLIDINTFLGDDALFNFTGGEVTTAIGGAALYNIGVSDNNTAIGGYALWSLQTGIGNVAVGAYAGINLTHGDSNIYIGNSGTQGENKKIRIGTTGTQTATYVAGISGATVATGVPVIVDTTGHLGTTTSSARYKDNVRPMDKTSEAILALKPVTFRYKHELDPAGIPQFGLVAEEVEKVNPDLVARDEQGKPYTVRYEAVNAMLLNEFLKEHRKVETLEATVAQQHKDFETVVAELKGQIQKVSAQLELSKSATQTVLNNN
jgi:Chaperone of endosialidase